MTQYYFFSFKECDTLTPKPKGLKATKCSYFVWIGFTLWPQLSFFSVDSCKAEADTFTGFCPDRSLHGCPGRELETGSLHNPFPTKTRANPVDAYYSCQYHSYLVLLNLANPIEWHNAAFRIELFPLGIEITQNHELALWSATEIILNQKQ